MTTDLSKNATDQTPSQGMNLADVTDQTPSQGMNPTDTPSSEQELVPPLRRSNRLTVSPPTDAPSSDCSSA
ncbi:UNVERIFIED_CONTAM: hypothetical protein Sradi_0880900 [Sesamum radiatum]|uniref:Uncharacterized protein n=1 Tax=Sesamum radiatum TaxID=300843 RepID=A0AAW2V796_SESRA